MGNNENLKYSKDTQKEKKIGSYRQALMGDLNMKDSEAKMSNEKQKSTSSEEWILVQRRKKVTKTIVNPSFTIFLYNFPLDILVKRMCEEIKSCGKVLDIILPRKRDKRNKRFGFIKTSSEEEAGLIILNAKEKGGLISRIRMRINEVVKEPCGDKVVSKGINNAKEIVDVLNLNTHENSAKVSGHSKRPNLHQNSTSKKARDFFEGDLGTRMCEFTELVVD